MKRRGYLRQCRNTKDYETIMNNYGNKMDNLEEIDRFLENFSLSRLNQEEIEIINDPITRTEIKAVIKNPPKNKSPRTKWLQRRILSNIQRTSNTYPSKTLSKIAEEGTFPNSFYEATIILTPEHENDATEKTIGQYH